MKDSKALPPEGSTENAAPPAGAAVPAPAGTVPPPPCAVLTLGDAGEILSAREACLAVLGWECDALVGQNIRVLLKGGLDNEIGRLLCRHRANQEITELVPFRLATLRKDRSEFLASFTTLAWNAGVNVVEQPQGVRLNWAIEIRPVAGEPERAAEVVAPGTPIAPASETSAAEPPREPVSQIRLPEPVPADLQESLRRFDEELVRLRRERDELSNQLAAEQQAAGVSRQRNEELQALVDSTKAAMGQMEATLKEEVTRKERLEERLTTLTNSLRLEQAERSKRFEQEQITLRQQRDQLNGRLAAEEKAAAESIRRAEELESRLTQNATEFERAKAELEQQNAERQRAESSFREQLDTAFVMKKELEGAFAGAVEWNKHVEEQLALLRKEHDELQARLEDEQKVAADSGRRAKDVESSLGRNAAEFDRIKTALQQQAAEREEAEATWREQLSAAKARKDKLEASLAEAVERNRRFEEDLAKLRRERDTLKARQQESSEAARRAEELRLRLEQQTAELKQARTQLDRQQTDGGRAESKLREQLEALRTQKKEVELAWATAVDRSVHLEEELAALRRERDELSGQTRGGGESNEQLEAARALAKKLELAWSAAVERNKRVEAELASLRRERDEPGPKATPDPRPLPEPKPRGEEPEKRSAPAALSVTPDAPRASARPPLPPLPQKKADMPAPKPETATRKPQEPPPAPLRKLEGNGAANGAAPTLPPRTPAQSGDLSGAPPVPPERYKLA